jgi:YesN/AraC family two-component response regulator
MFNVLIVDDDQIDVEGLCQFVNWEELGYNVIGIARSAKEAVGIIETEFVDVMLTDIVMPGKSGLELIKDANLINPHIKTVILSGYGEFGFAKEAIRLGAFDYLTKPVNFAELKSIFNRLKESLNNDIRDKQKQVEFQSIRHMQFLNNLVNGFFQTEDTIHEKAFEIGLKLDKRNFCLIRFLIDEKNNQKDRKNVFGTIKLDLSDKAAAFFNKFGAAYVFDNNLNEMCMLFFPNDINELERILEKFSAYLTTLDQVDVFQGIGCTYDTIVKAPLSYQQAGKALAYRYMKKDRLLNYRNLMVIYSKRSVITPDNETNIQDYLLNGEADLLEKYIVRILSELNMIDRADKGILFDTCIEVLLIINKCLENFSDRDNLKVHNNHDAIRTLLKKNSYEDVLCFIVPYMRECCAYISENKEKPMGFVIENVINYINEHYNENITLHKLSEITYMHPTYLSRLFKEKTGENFIEYLMKVRIERSKKLLENLSLRIYDVCEMVGYESPKHFCKLFKDITGITPKDYRNKKETGVHHEGKKQTAH